MGLVNGICQVYEYFKGGQDYQVKHIQNINCKNRKGYFAKGTKVTSIVFFSGNELVEALGTDYEKFSELIDSDQDGIISLDELENFVLLKV